MQIAGYETSADGLAPTGTVEVEVTGAETAVELPAGDVFQVNAGDLTFAAVRTDADSFADLRSRVAQLPDALSRTLVVATAWDMLVKGELAGEAVVDVIAEVLRVETSPAVVEGLLALGLAAAEQWSPLERIPALMARLAEVSEALLASPEHHQPAARTLAATATEDRQFDLLREPAEQDIDLAWRVLARQAELGRYDAAAVAELEQRDPDPDAFAAALAVRGSQADPAAKQELWQAMMIDRRIPAGPPRGTAARRFWRPLQADLLAGYADQYLDVLDSFSDAGMLGQLGIIRGMFPFAVVSDAFLDRAEAAATAPGVNPTVRTTLLGGVDTGRRMLRARAS